MIMSGEVDVSKIDIGKLENVLFDCEKETKTNHHQTMFHLSQGILEEMSDLYEFCLVWRMNPQAYEIKSFTREDGMIKRPVKFSASTLSTNKSVNSYVYTVRTKDQYSHTIDVHSVEDVVFGSISKIYQHKWKDQLYTWVLLDVFEDVKCTDGFWSVKRDISCQKPFLIRDVSVPQVVAWENDRLVFVSTDVQML